MSITPDPTRNIGDSCCSKCGKLLLVNDSAIVHTDMRDGASLVLGNCCADLFIGGALQDFAVLLKRQSFVGELISTTNTMRLRRLSEAALAISREYDLALEYRCLTEGLNHESE